MSKNLVLERRSVSEGGLIVRQGDDGKAAYLIQSGVVRVYTESAGKKTELAKLYPGDIFGEMTLVSEDKRSASVEAVEKTTLIVIERDVFEKKLENSDPTIRAMLKMLMERLLKSNQSSAGKQSSIETLDQDVESIYQAALLSLPRNRQRTFENAIHPKIEELSSAIQSFKGRYEDDL